MRADGGRLQLGVVIDPHTEEGQGRGLLIAVKNGSRLLPGARIAPEACRCDAVWSQIPLFTSLCACFPC